MNSRELAGALTGALRGEEGLPVPIRALLAAALICERGGAPSKSGMARVGGFSYGSSQNHYADLLTAIVEGLPRRLAGMTSAGTDPVLASTLRRDLQDRDATITQLRAELAGLVRSQAEVRRYVLALHERLREMEAQTAAGSGQKVSPLWPVP